MKVTDYHKASIIVFINMLQEKIDKNNYSDYSSETLWKCSYAHLQKIRDTLLPIYSKACQKKLIE